MILLFNPTDIMDYLMALREPVERLQIRMEQTQHNLNEIKTIMSAWAKVPLFERKDSKKDSVLCMEERNERIARRYAEMESASKMIHTYVLHNCPTIYSQKFKLFPPHLHAVC